MSQVGALRANRQAGGIPEACPWQARVEELMDQVIRAVV